MFLNLRRLNGWRMSWWTWCAVRQLQTRNWIGTQKRSTQTWWQHGEIHADNNQSLVPSTMWGVNATLCTTKCVDTVASKPHLYSLNIPFFIVFVFSSGNVLQYVLVPEYGDNKRISETGYWLERLVNSQWLSLYWRCWGQDLVHVCTDLTFVLRSIIMLEQLRTRLCRREILFQFIRCPLTFGYIKHKSDSFFQDVVFLSVCLMFIKQESGTWEALFVFYLGFFWSSEVLRLRLCAH